jgi:hypothetical protein
VQLLLPNLLGNLLPEWIIEPFYFGTVPVNLIVGWLVGKRQAPPSSEAQPHDAARTRLAWFALTLGGLAIFLALGSNGGLYSLQMRLPLVKHFRAPARYVNLLGFAAGVLSALAASRLLATKQASEDRDGETNGRPLVFLALPWFVVIVGLSIAAAFRLRYPAAEPSGLANSFWAGPIFLLGGAATWMLAARGRRIGLLLLTLLLGLDVGLFVVKGKACGRVAWDYTMPLSDWKANADLPPIRHAGRILGLFYEAAHVLPNGERLVNGYKGGLEPRKLLDYQQLAALRVSGAAWVRQHEGIPGFYVPGLRSAGKGWYEVPRPLPRVRLLDRSQMSEDPAADLQHIDVDTTALTTHPLDLDVGRPGKAEMLEEQPGELHLRVETTGRQLLVIADSHDPAWQVQIDGTPGTVERVNGDFLGCVVEAGRHDVRFVFLPASLYYGRRLTGTGLVLALLVAGFVVGAGWVERRRMRRGVRECPPELANSASSVERAA